ncbi:MAG: hypothetical protein D8M54_00945 [Chloroflexi bacterium]|nr:hypothetical protein [Chloroflexota bacterium]
MAGSSMAAAMPISRRGRRLAQPAANNTLAAPMAGYNKRPCGAVTVCIHTSRETVASRQTNANKRNKTAVVCHIQPRRQCRTAWQINPAAAPSTASPSSPYTQPANLILPQPKAAQ